MEGRRALDSAQPAFSNALLTRTRKGNEAHAYLQI
jgi:hypothetical protein